MNVLKVVSTRADLGGEPPLPSVNFVKLDDKT